MICVWDSVTERFPSNSKSGRCRTAEFHKFLFDATLCICEEEEEEEEEATETVLHLFCRFCEFEASFKFDVRERSETQKARVLGFGGCEDMKGFSGLQHGLPTKTSTMLSIQRLLWKRIGIDLDGSQTIRGVIDPCGMQNFCGDNEGLRAVSHTIAPGLELITLLPVGNDLTFKKQIVQNHLSVRQVRISCNGRTKGIYAAMDNESTAFDNSSVKKFHRNLNDSWEYNLSSDHLDIHEARTEEELRVAAWLRAQTHSEQQPYTRFIDSFKKKFAEQEYTALKRRVSGQFGKCICLLAVTKFSSQDQSDLSWQVGGKLNGVLGTLDISLHHPSPGESFGGQALPYGYIANVCVDKFARQRGIASALLKFAVNIGHDWGLNAIYVHTHATNKPAHQLYVKSGFKVLQGAIEMSLDDTLLLRLQM